MKGFCFVLLFSVVFAKHEMYQGWKSYYIQPSSPEDLKLLNSVSEVYEVDMIRDPIVKREGVALVKPQFQEGFTNFLEKNMIKYWIHANDVKTALDQDDLRNEAIKNLTRTRSNHRQMLYNSYQDLETVYNYIDDIAERFPETVTLITPANSFEGRPLKVLKISTTNFEDESKPVIFIDAAVHAREWQTIPVATWAIRKLTEDITEPDLLERFDWIIYPVVNPDGYKFSYEVNRWWRMTRSIDANSSGNCFGVDGNRNYDFHWNTVGVGGICSDVYPGMKAFSESETSVVRDIIDEYIHRMPLYITMHSEGSMILYGWGHDGTLSYNAFALHVVGIAMAEAIDASSPSYFWPYTVGNAAQVLWYGASGASEDYAHAEGVPLSYTFELPHLPFVPGSFVGNTEYIEQICRDTWEGIVVGARRAGDMYPVQK